MLFVLGSTVEGIKYVQVLSDVCTLVITIVIIISMLKELNKLKKTI